MKIFSPFFHPQRCLEVRRIQLHWPTPTPRTATRSRPTYFGALGRFFGLDIAMENAMENVGKPHESLENVGKTMGNPGKSHQFTIFHG